MKKSFYTFLFLAWLCLPFIRASALSNTLTLDLKLGDTNQEVMLLQQILNLDKDTRVADQGPGSKGSETSYFGTKTESALKRFQVKYASLIDLSNSISPSGMLDYPTRRVLNAILSTNSPQSKSSAMKLSTPSNQSSIYKVSPSNFGLSTSSISSLYQFLPQGYDVSAINSPFEATRNGAYSALDTAIESYLKKNFSIDIKAQEYATSSLSSAIPLNLSQSSYSPYIKLNQSKVKFSDLISLTGLRLTKSNSVYTTLGKVENSFLSGTSTINFRLNDIKAFTNYLPDNQSTTTTQIYVWITNENGVSNVAGPLSVNI